MAWSFLCSIFWGESLRVMSLRIPSNPGCEAKANLNADVFEYC